MSASAFTIAPPLACLGLLLILVGAILFLSPLALDNVDGQAITTGLWLLGIGLALLLCSGGWLAYEAAVTFRRMG